MLQAIDVDDLVEIIAVALDSSPAGVRIFNCCHPEVFSAAEYYGWIAEELGCPLEIVDVQLEEFLGTNWGWARAAVSRSVDARQMRVELNVIPNRAPDTAVRTWARWHRQCRCYQALEGNDPLASIIQAARDGRRAELVDAINSVSGVRRRSAVDVRMNKPPLPDLR